MQSDLKWHFKIQGVFPAQWASRAKNGTQSVIILVSGEDLTHSLTHSLTHTHPPTHPLTHSLTHQGFIQDLFVGGGETFFFPRLSGAQKPPNSISGGFWQLADCSQVPISCVQNHCRVSILLAIVTLFFNNSGGVIPELLLHSLTHSLSHSLL